MNQRLKACPRRLPRRRSIRASFRKTV
jgi:hypothetical protein